MQAYFPTMIEEGLYSDERKLRFHLDSVFDGIDFANRRMLDIGGGRGLHSFYADSMGASEVVCLEPEDAGSASGMAAAFSRTRELLGAGSARIEPVTVQEFKPASGFDVILLHDAINHLDEAACITLHKDAGSRATYLNVLRQIAAMANPGAHIIVCDCSRYNVFALLRVRNPLVPTIEWHKHQSPRLWAGLLREAGFTDPQIHWTTFNRLGKAGSLLLGNAPASYFLTSHFRLVMQR